MRSATSALFCSKEALLKKHASPAIKKNGERLQVEVEELWRLLIAAATDPEAGNVICILDALDECKQNERNTLIRMLEDFYKGSSAHFRIGSRLKFLVTSRPYQHIELSFSSLTKDIPTIRLAGEYESEHISREINLVVTAKVKEIGERLGVSDAVRSSLERRLLEMTNRTYLWLTLILDEIPNAPGKTEKKLLKAIEELPQTVDEAYEKLLTKCIKREDARKILQIIVAAERPLTLEEMDVALEIQAALEKQADSKSYADLDREGGKNRKTQIRELCGLFVSIADSKIYLIHQTAKEFLIKRTDTESGLGVWKHSVDLQESHRLLAEICTTHLLFEEFRENPLLSLTEHLESVDEVDEVNKVDKVDNYQVDKVDKYKVDKVDKCKVYDFLQAYSAEHAFLDYSANHWTSHFRKAVKSESDRLPSLASELFVGIGPEPPTWLIFYIGADIDTGLYEDWPYKMACSLSGEKISTNRPWALYFAALEGLTGLVRRLSKSGVDIDAQGGFYGNALQAAIKGGRTEIVQLLIQANVDVNAKGGHYGTALQAAAVYKNMEVVRLLLQANADVNAQGGAYGNALQAAVAGENKEIAQLLIQAGADVNTQGGQEGKEHSLHAAVTNGDEEVVQMLLQAGADANARSEFWSWTLQRTIALSALYVAVAHQHERVVQLLLQAKADVNAQGGLYGTALNVAVGRGNQRLVQLLLEAGADVNARNEFYSEKLGGSIAGEALYLAVIYQYEEVVEVLLQNGADVNARNLGGLTALHAAVILRGESQRIVQLLLQAKADVNARCEFYSEKLGRRRSGDALFLAVKFDHGATVETLLHWGAAANPDSYCEALQMAKVYGYEDIVERLEKWVQKSPPEEPRLSVKRSAEASDEVRMAKRTTPQWLEANPQLWSDD